MISSVTHRERIVKYSHKNSVTATSMVFSVSRSTLYRWRTAYATHGREGLRPRSTALHDPKTVMTDLLRQRILAHRTLGYGPQKITVLLKREGIRLSHMTVYRFLKRKRLVRPQTQRKKHYNAWSREAPNELWQMDFKGPYEREGRTLWRFDLLDDASRLLITSVECERASSKVVLDTMRAAVKRYGSPLQVLTDNGAVFVSLRGGVSAFHRWCIENRVQHIRARRNHPQTLGKVERVHRTIHTESERMGKELDEYIEYYNTERPHSSLGYRTPWELYDTPRRYGAPC
jgi:transposase InsO family protein